MAGLWLMWLRVIGTVLVLTLALLLAPTPQVVAKAPPKLPGYAANQDPPPGAKPLSYPYKSANALSSLGRPTAEELAEINRRAKSGTKDHLFKSWDVYQQQRAPAMANPLDWEGYRSAYINAFNNRNVGTGFETALDRELTLTENGYVRNRKVKGVDINRRPDFHNDEEMIEVKTGAIDKAQYRDFIRIAQQTGRRLIYITPDMLSPATYNEMMDIAKEMDFADSVFFRQVPALGTADPPGTGPLASSTQKPSAGSADQTTGASPANAETAIERAFVGGRKSTATWTPRRGRTPLQRRNLCLPLRRNLYPPPPCFCTGICSCFCARIRPRTTGARFGAGNCPRTRVRLIRLRLTRRKHPIRLRPCRPTREALLVRSWALDCKAALRRQRGSRALWVPPSAEQPVRYPESWAASSAVRPLLPALPLARPAALVPALPAGSVPSAAGLVVCWAVSTSPPWSCATSRTRTTAGPVCAMRSPPTRKQGPRRRLVARTTPTWRRTRSLCGCRCRRSRSR